MGVEERNGYQIERETHHWRKRAEGETTKDKICRKKDPTFSHRTAAVENMTKVMVRPWQSCIWQQLKPSWERGDGFEMQWFDRKKMNQLPSAAPLLMDLGRLMEKWNLLMCLLFIAVWSELPLISFLQLSYSKYISFFIWMLCLWSTFVKQFSTSNVLSSSNFQEGL